MENYDINLNAFKEDLVLLSLYADKKKTTEACLKKKFPYTARNRMAPHRITPLEKKELIRLEDHHGKLILKKHAFKICAEIERTIKYETGFLPETAAAHNKKRLTKKTDRKVRLNNDVLLSILYLYFFSETVVRGNGEIIAAAPSQYPADWLWKLQYNGYIERKEYSGYSFIKPEGVKQAKRLKILHFGGPNVQYTGREKPRAA
jgi:hypothetical protein